MLKLISKKKIKHNFDQICIDCFGSDVHVSMVIKTAGSNLPHLVENFRSVRVYSFCKVEIHFLSQKF